MKSLFEQDESWISFVEFTSLAQKFMRQTEVAALAPPNQRSKARYLNIDIIIRWAQRIILLMESQDKIQSIFNPDLVDRTLIWITYFKDDIKEWGEILDVAEAIKSTINKKGLYRGLRDDLSKVLATTIPVENTRAMELQDAALSYAGSLEYKVHVGDRLPGCSDVIESLFGRFKHLEQQQSGSGFTQLLLALPALVGKKSTELLKQAMETVKVSDLSLWLKENIGMSVQAKRKLAFSAVKAV
jgi:DNA-binding phage protein